MKKNYLLLMFVLLLGYSCSKSDSNSNPFITPTQPISNNIYQYILEANFNQDEEVFIIFTNQDAMTKQNKRISIEGPSSSKNITSNYSKSSNSSTDDFAAKREAERRKISEEYFNYNKERVLSKSFIDLKPSIKKSIEGSKSEFHAIKEFRYYTDSDYKVNATLKKQVKSNSDGRTLNLWVEDGYSINSEKLEKLANSFLREGKNNDIYGYITSIYGKEWYEVGEATPEGFIHGTDTIDILIYRINDDIKNSKGITLGFYWAKDNLINGWEIRNSNERLMFYLEAEIVNNDDIDTAISTLAHEFVHMVNFRQNSLRNNRFMDTWLDEMLAMISEDLLAKKLNVEGPYEERIPVFNDIIRYTPINEQSENFGLHNYAQTYAYGAYLIRNIIEEDGNLDFIKDIVNSRYSNHRAIEEAMKKANKDYSFEDSIKLFSKAALLSDLKFSNDKNYKYNIVKKFKHDEVEYNINPINVYDYKEHETFNAYPVNYKYAPFLNYGGMQYFSLGRLNGSQSFIFNIPEGVDYEFVVRTSNEYKKNRSKELQNKLIRL